MPVDRTNDFQFQRSRVITDYTMQLLEKRVSKDPMNAVTPDNPLLRRLKQKNAKRGGKSVLRTGMGGFPEKAQILYRTERRTVPVSQRTGIVHGDLTEIDPFTEAEFPYVGTMTNLTLDTVKMRHAKSNLDAYTKYVMGKKRATLLDVRQIFDEMLWNGFSDGSDRMWGIKQAIRPNPAVNPAMGPVGGLDATDADYGVRVQNQVQDFDGAAFSFAGGDRDTALLLTDDGAKGMDRLYKDCSYNALGDEGRPDMFPCNALFYTSFKKCVTGRQEFHNEQNNNDLGLPDSLWYRSGPVFEDDAVGNGADAPGTASAGTCYFLNTNFWDVVMAQNFAKDVWDVDWEDHGVIPGSTAHVYQMVLQWTQVWEALRWNGLMHGVTAGSSVSGE